MIRKFDASVPFILKVTFLRHRCSLNPLRSKNSEDISKPLGNSFRHTGHGDPYGKSWGSPATIEDLNFRKSKSSNSSPVMSTNSILNFTSPLNDRKKSMYGLKICFFLNFNF